MWVRASDSKQAANGAFETFPQIQA